MLLKKFVHTAAPVRATLLVLAFALVFSLVASSPAAAQFNAFAWTFNAGTGGSGSTSGDTMGIHGPDGIGGCPSGTTATFTTTAPYAATVAVDFTFYTLDEGGGLFDFPVTLLNGVETEVQAEDGTLIFDVDAGATFGFGVHSTDCAFGEGVLNLSGLQFVPKVLGPDVAGKQAGEAFGAAVAAAGDFTGDGVSELLVGAPGADTPAVNAGRAYLLDGSSGTVLRMIPGMQPGEALGSAVAGGGDADGDGTPDFLVSSPLLDVGGTDAGGVRVISGADGHTLFKLSTGVALDQFGASVAFAGDLDGDGSDDILCGVPFNDTAGTDAGAALVFSGAGGALLFTLTGTSPGDQFGAAVAGLGDINADGIPDLAVGAPDDDDVASNAGSVRLVSGADFSTLFLLHPAAPGATTSAQFGSAVAAAGDVDADGTPDVIVGAPSGAIFYPFTGNAWVFSGATGAVLHMFQGLGVADHLGASVAGAGDVDGDGYADVIVGTPQTNVQPPKNGRAFVYSGRDGKLLGAIASSATFDALGTAVAGVGDVDGDGRADVLVGSPGDDTAFADAGRAVVLRAKLLWSYLGGSVSGTHGAPLLAPEGLLIGGSPISLTFSHALENTPATLVIGLSLLGAPFKGGTFVPSPDIVVVGLPTGPAGGFTLAGSWPTGLPSGLSLYLQTWLPDPAGVQGFAASPGVQLTAP